jgi:hypothetical protein
MSKRRKRRVMGKVRHDGLISRMVDADCSPAELAAELGLTLADLAAWASDAHNIRALEILARLADIRAQLVVSKYRANAAAQLIQIATASNQSDLSRKACVDLLEADLGAFEFPQSEVSHSDHDTAVVEPDDVLATLERIGREALDELRGDSRDANQSHGNR